MSNPRSLDTPTLRALFERIGTPDPRWGDRSTLAAVPIPGFDRHRLARELDGSPCILIDVARSSDRRSPPIVLENLKVEHDVLCEIVRVDGVQESGRFSVVTCLSRDEGIRDYFFHTMEALLRVVGPAPTLRQVATSVESMVRLFRALVAPAKKSIQGVWGELFLIARSRHPTVLVGAWHATPDDHFDFNAGSHRIEVKSTAGRLRRHYFSFEQTHPPSGASAIVASLFVEPAGAGLSIGDLLERIRRRLSSHPDLALRVDIATGEMLGVNFQHANRERFDGELAEESLVYFDVRAVPSICEALPAGISEVRYKADLTSCTPLTREELEEASLYRAGLGAR